MVDSYCSLSLSFFLLASVCRRLCAVPNGRRCFRAQAHNVAVVAQILPVHNADYGRLK